MKDGYEKDYFPNGRIESEGDYLYGKRDGVWKFYYDEGVYCDEDTLKIEMSFDGGITLRSVEGEVYKGDVKDGYYKSYFLGRKLKCEGQYHFNLKDGIWNHYNIEGKLIKEEVYKMGELVEQKDY